ncbi:DUF385 domain-containing protein [Skermania sp. ID1734]|uniref:nitroreductase/quinone reductase family protein n=1 Tax=Skermania sp. ID1734 TaxID=2597516 RepID=UPI001180102D|nr:nitroreductase/quinone reductase family protein [Skermania sp. ID1734]TSE00749.1 DUF385 domain-containing protein [Skermania sp. ID1734]
MTTYDRKRYLEPGTGAFAQVPNRIMARLAKWGISVAGSRLLLVQGRKTGAWHSTPVNLLEYNGDRYLVAPRGNTQWVRNLRASSTGQLQLGRRRDTFTAVELADDAKPELLRAYLQRLNSQVSGYFDGVGPDADDSRLREIAPGYPVFRIA